MGVMEYGTPEPDSNMIETKKNCSRENKIELLTPENNQMDYQRFGSEREEHEEVIEAKNIEKKFVPTEEISDRITEVGPNHEDISQIGGKEKQELLFENVKIFSVAGNLVGAPQNGLTDLAHSGTASLNSGDRKIEPLHLDATTVFVQSENEDKGICGQSKAELKGPLISSWTLRSKSQEKPKAREPTDTTKEGSANEEKRRRGRKKNQMQKNNVNEFSRIRSHLRYLLHRINYEQNLIDAYSAEGWRGQSLDKLKPEKELEKAKSHILSYKMKIRTLFQQLDQSLAAGKLPESLFDSQGEIDSEDIFCAKCGSKDLTVDNDIILCDGACERGFHLFCLEPPLLKKDIPPGDESWLCPGCDCKANCIDILKDFLGTKISILDSWERIFPEAAAAAAASGKKLDDGSVSTSDDSEDEEYDPDKPDRADTDANIEGDESISEESSYFSASDDLAVVLNSNEKCVGLPSDDSEDDDFDPSAPYQEETAKQDSSSSDFTSDSEDLEALLGDENVPVKDELVRSPSDHKQLSAGSTEETSKMGTGKRQSLEDELSYLTETSMEPMSSRRRVEWLDYKKLYDETYGNTSYDSSDEDSDFDDTTTRKRTRTKRKKTEVKSSDNTPIIKSNIHTNDENQTESKQSPVHTCKNGAAGGTTELSAEVGSASTGAKRSKNRLGEATIQKLYASFYENQYPKRAVKENLAKELGLTIKQVSKWFGNSRWSFYHRPQMEPNSTERPCDPQPAVCADSAHSNQNDQLQQPSGIRGQNHISGAKEENLVTNTSGEHSRTQKTRKRKCTSALTFGDIIVNNKSHETNDTQSPSLHTSKRQTRSSSSGS